MAKKKDKKETMKLLAAIFRVASLIVLVISWFINGGIITGVGLAFCILNVFFSIKYENMEEEERKKILRELYR